MNTFKSCALCQSIYGIKLEKLPSNTEYIIILSHYILHLNDLKEISKFCYWIILSLLGTFVAHLLLMVNICNSISLVFTSIS